MQITGSNRSKLTDINLRQPRQRIDAVPLELLVHDVVLTVGVDVGHAAEHLQRRLDQPRQPEHPEDEAAGHDDGREEEALRGEDEDGQDEDEAQGSRGDHVGEDPGLRI